MIHGISDNSTETFWESGDEDRNKPKTITITCQGKANPRIVYVHIDNTRDIGVSTVRKHGLFECTLKLLVGWHVQYFFFNLIQHDRKAS